MEQDELNEKADKVMLALCNSIKNRREELNYSVDDVAKACGMPKSSYYAYERAETKFPIDKLLRVLMFLKMDSFAGVAEIRPKEQTLVAITQDNVSNFFSAVLENQNELSKEVVNQKQDISEIKQMLQELLGKKQTDI